MLPAYLTLHHVKITKVKCKKYWARAALEESFDMLGLDEVCSVPQKDNPASSRVCERIGMKLEREVTIPANTRRGELTALLYKMTRVQWRTMHED